MTLIKTSLLNAIAVAIKMLTMLGINKTLAIYVGPSGYAALGQFQNAVQIATTLGGGCINNGVIKYTAEHHENQEKQKEIWRTAGTTAILSAFISAILIIFFDENLAIYFFQDLNLKSVFIWFAFSLVFFILNLFFLAILNGKKEIKIYIIANIAGSILSLIATVIMSINFGLKGALIAFAINPSISFLATFLICYKLDWFKFFNFFGRININIAKDLSKFAIMAIISAACVPVSHIFIRNYLAKKFGIDAAGYWEAMWRLSAAYLLFITTTFSLYFLPKISEIKKLIEIKVEIIQGYKIILPVTAIFGVVIYLFRDFIISVLFSESFKPMRELFAWQMVGDFLKIGSWILAYLMLAKALMKIYIFTEILFSFGFYALTCLFTSIFGLKGVAMAHAANYIFYWLTIAICLFILRNKFSEK